MFSISVAHIDQAGRRDAVQEQFGIKRQRMAWLDQMQLNWPLVSVRCFPLTNASVELVDALELIYERSIGTHFDHVNILIEESGLVLRSVVDNPEYP